MSSAGTLFNCVCCREDKDQQEAVNDITFNGPVCEDCRGFCEIAVGRLSRAKINRPFASTDVNTSNLNRIKQFYNK